VRDNEGVSLYRDEGVVLRTQKLGEADRIITILTRRTGRVRAAAKGVRKTKSRFGARLEPFTHVDLQLYERRSLDLITQAETLRPYGERLVADYPRYTAGTAMLETAEKLTPIEREPALRHFLLVIGGLRTLVEGGHDPRLVLDAFFLRSLAVAGYAPALEECARCGEPTGRAFAIAAGGMVCAACRPPGSASPAEATIALMIALLRGDWARADLSESRHRVECSGLVAAYLQWHLEHGIRSLRHVEREQRSERSDPLRDEAGRGVSEQRSATVGGVREQRSGDPLRDEASQYMIIE
jgi:DNA repair protein RecO (recombination protein O)